MPWSEVAWAEDAASLVLGSTFDVAGATGDQGRLVREHHSDTSAGRAPAPHDRRPHHAATSTTDPGCRRRPPRSSRVSFHGELPLKGRQAGRARDVGVRHRGQAASTHMLTLDDTTVPRYG